MMWSHGAHELMGPEQLGPNRPNLRRHAATRHPSRFSMWSNNTLYPTHEWALMLIPLLESYRTTLILAFMN